MRLFTVPGRVRGVSDHHGGDSPIAVSATDPAEVSRQMTVQPNEELAVKPETASAFMAQAVLGFNEQLERIGEIAVVVMVGALLAPEMAEGDALWFVPLLLLVVRPIAVLVGLIGTHTDSRQRGLMAWCTRCSAGELKNLSNQPSGGTRSVWIQNW